MTYPGQELVCPCSDALPWSGIAVPYSNDLLEAAQWKSICRQKLQRTCDISGQNRVITMLVTSTSDTENKNWMTQIHTWHSMDPAADIVLVLAITDLFATNSDVLWRKLYAYILAFTLQEDSTHATREQSINQSYPTVNSVSCSNDSPGRTFLLVEKSQRHLGCLLFSLYFVFWICPCPSEISVCNCFQFLLGVYLILVSGLIRFIIILGYVPLLFFVPSFLLVFLSWSGRITDLFYQVKKYLLTVPTPLDVVSLLKLFYFIFIWLW